MIPSPRTRPGLRLPSPRAAADVSSRSTSSHNTSSRSTSSTASRLPDVRTPERRTPESRGPRVSLAAPDADDADGLSPLLDTTSLRYELVDLATAAQLLRDILRDQDADTPPEEAIRIAGSMQKRLSELAQRLHDASSDEAASDAPSNDAASTDPSDPSNPDG